MKLSKLQRINLARFIRHLDEAHDAIPFMEYVDQIDAETLQLLAELQGHIYRVRTRINKIRDEN